MQTVLIAEDEPKSSLALRNKIKKILGESVFIAIAENGREAIDLALKLNPALIIMDIEMPLRNGLEAAKVIQPHLPDTKVVFLTAYDRFDYAVTAMRAGGKDYLLKPVSEADLKKLLDTYLTRALKVDDKADKDLAAHDNPFKTSIVVWINNHYMKDIGIEDASQAMGISPYYFSRKFKEFFQQTFLEYLTHYRLEIAKRLLETTDLTVAEIAPKIGYADPNYFMKTFKRHISATPTQYRNLVRGA